jgi:hypothetical protein
MSTADACRSPALVQLDWCVLSLLFSHSLAFEYADVTPLCVFFFTWFMIMHNTSTAHMCPETAETHTTASIWDEYIQDTINALA